ncbi:hypothetical protein DSM3645_03523 [Blastopirellula marina DSM 3645]|uniref:Uncharacterized protein n=1 Tax=Blastopirellula marina DSM 3645 TaxID=314230 RepID=A3ZW18_9BACT|nr:hypothetical protein DSM3645_03523 [Blastopirellula marina DSM 3645]
MPTIWATATFRPITNRTWLLPTLIAWPRRE